MSKVTIVTHPETGNVVTQNPNKPEYGSIRVDQEVKTFTNGYLNRSKRVAFIGGTMEDLNEMNFREGQILPGKIVVKEQLEAFYSGQSPKINPETNEVLTQGGQPIYRNSFYTEDLTAFDMPLTHDTVEEGISHSVAVNQEITEELEA